MFSSFPSLFFRAGVVCAFFAVALATQAIAASTIAGTIYDKRETAAYRVELSMISINHEGERGPKVLAVSVCWLRMAIHCRVYGFVMIW